MFRSGVLPGDSAHSARARVETQFYTVAQFLGHSAPVSQLHLPKVLVSAVGDSHDCMRGRRYVSQEYVNKQGIRIRFHLDRLI
jgi:hypothetical protein